MTKFEEPILEVVKFNSPDVITTSGNVAFNEAMDEYTTAGDAWTNGTNTSIFFTM